MSDRHVCVTHYESDTRTPLLCGKCACLTPVKVITLNMTWAHQYSQQVHVTVQEGNGFKALLKGSMPAWAVQEAGAPAEVWLDIQAPEDTDSLLLDVIWVNKTATRLPEVITLSAFVQIPSLIPSFVLFYMVTGATQGQ